MSDGDADDRIQYRKEGGLRWLIVKRPEKRNALSIEMRLRALEVIHEVERDADARVLIVAGAGETFISGGDISEFVEQRGDAEAAARINGLTELLLHELQNLEKPVIAMIHGFCFGGGLLLAASCDLRLCADNALFCYPAARLGIAYPMHLTRLILNLTGVAAAREMMYTARRYTAGEAAAMGLANRVVPKAELETYTRGYAQEIANNAPLSIKASKIALDECLKEPGQRDPERVARILAACDASEDLGIGARAFLGKKKPVFIGR